MPFTVLIMAVGPLIFTLPEMQWRTMVMVFMRLTMARISLFKRKISMVLQVAFMH